MINSTLLFTINSFYENNILYLQNILYFYRNYPNIGLSSFNCEQ